MRFRDRLVATLRHAYGALTVVLLCLLALPAPVASAESHPGTADKRFSADLNGIRRGHVNAGASQANGGLILGGAFTTYTGERNLIRLKPNGRMDEKFATTGPWTQSTVLSVAVQPDGKIIVGTDRAVFRLKSNGFLDTSFTTAYNYRLVALLSTGKIMVQGGGHLVRLNPDGSRDMSFSADTQEAVSQIVELPDGDLVAANANYSYNGSATPRLMRLNPDGTSDPNFVFPTELATAQWAGSMAIRPGGRISALFSMPQAGANDRYERVGLNPDGSIDQAFQVSYLEDYESPLAIGQPDGKVVTGSKSEVFRLNDDGTRDVSFKPLRVSALGLVLGSNGAIVALAESPDVRSQEVLHILRQDGTNTKTLSLTGGGFNRAVGEVLALPHRKILVSGGFTRYDGSPAQQVARLKANGRRDTSFRVRGKGFQGSWDARYGHGGVSVLAAQPNGKYLVGGDFGRYNGFRTLSLARLNRNGTRDKSFQASRIRGYVDSLEIQSDGKIVVGGDFTHFGKKRAVYVLRLNRDGSLDRSFSSPLTASEDASVDALAIQPDGRIVLGGFATYPTLLRLNADGTRDTSFRRNIKPPALDVSVIELQKDGRILIAGGFTHYDGHHTGHVARLMPDGSLDRTFAPGGLRFRQPRWSVTPVNSAAIQPDGKIVLAGQFSALNGHAAHRLVRLRPNGTRDATFRQAGSGIGPASVNSLARRSDDTIVAGGDFTSYNGHPYGRLLWLHG